jgi:metal transporter CNNM
MEIISEHEQSEHSPIDRDEKRIVHGALQFSHTRVREVMTKAEEVVSFSEDRILNDEFMQEVNDCGYSRLPIYQDDPANITGILYVKDLIVEDENIPIHATTEAYDKEYLTVRDNSLLDQVLAKMLKTRQHIAVVRDHNRNFTGVVSLEDIIEEIIQQEIVDEDDDE